MSHVLLLGLVLLAGFGLVSLVLSGLLAAAWRAGLERATLASLDLLGLRLLPSAGALLVALAVVLPAFVAYEPTREYEAAGPWLFGFAVLAVVCIGHGIWRGVRACNAARALLESCGVHHEDVHRYGGTVNIVDLAEPLVAVIGALHPRIVATKSVTAACDPDELREVLAHEAAHVAARDNLKLLALVAAPDVLAWTPLAAGLTARWRAAAEREADRRATRDDPGRRLALASALIKVARLFGNADRPRPALGMRVAEEDVPARVRRLLAPPGEPSRAVIVLGFALCAAVLGLLALPQYAHLHELIEQLVSLGR